MQLKLVPAREGFTLIETVVYIGLLTIMIGGTLLTVYRLMGDLNGMRGKVNTDEEANFLLRKIDWALTGASAVSIPSSDTLVVTKVGFSPNPIKIDLASTTLELSRGGGTPTPLNSVNVVVSSTTFQHLTAPEGVSTTITVNGRAYQLIKYLR